MFAEDLGYDLTDTVWKYDMAAVTVKISFDENAENTVAIPREDSDLKSYVFPELSTVACEGICCLEGCKKGCL